ncbi:MAG: transcription elongation factor GreA [Simkaniaceae bacterium]
MDYYKQIAQKISENDYSSFISLWEEYCMSDTIDPQELKKILERIKESEWKEHFGKYIEQILPLVQSMEDENEAYQCLKLILDLQTSNSETLANAALEALQKRFGDQKDFNEKLRLCGLREKQDFQGAISKFELLNHMKVGNFVFHTAGWGVGEFVDVSFLREQVSLEFDYVAGKKDFSFENAFRTLIPLNEEHFLSKRFGNPDALEKFAKEDPVAVIHLLLKDLGPKTAAEIKEEMFELVIPEEEWQKWWQNARTKLKKDTLVEIPEDAKEPYRLRQTEVTHEERLVKALEEKPTADTLIQMLYNFMRDFPAALKKTQFNENLKTKLKEVLSFEELSDSQELQIHFILEDLNSEGEESTVKEMIERFPSLDDVVQGIDILAFKKRALVDIRKYRKDWISIFSSLLFIVDQNPLRDYILAELLNAEQKEIIIKKLNELLEEPGYYPTAFLWYFQKIMKKSSLPLADKEGKNRFLEAFFTLLYILEQRDNAKDLVKKMHNFMTSAKYANIRKIFSEAPKELVQEVLLLATKCLSLSDHDIKILHSLAEVVHPSLAKLRKKYDKESEKEEEVIWSTEEGFIKLKNRIHQLATVETVENAREIEEARSHGDLRENAEYKAALEKRDRLQGEMQFLSQQMDKIRILSKEEVSTKRVGVGCIVECKDSQGRTFSYTLLGPWDADVEQNILSFQSKLAKEMEGLSVGDKFKVQNNEYTITNIKNYFEELAAKA